VIAYYRSVKKNIEEKGVVKWFMDGFRQKTYGFLKLSLKVTAFVLVHNLIVNATGFSILNPLFLLTLLVIAVGLSAYSSYKAQKDMGGMDAKTTAIHLFEEMRAA
jgi:FtsH-binding integral membrane protein